MQYQNASELSPKAPGSHRNAGVSQFIRDALEAIPKDQALGMAELATDVTRECPTVPDRRQAYVRINNVLSRSKEFVKLVDQDGKTWLGHANGEPKDEEEGEEDEGGADQD